MRLRPLFPGALLLFSPALLATALAVAGCLKVIPFYEKQEQRRQVGEYREVAAQLRENPTLGADVKPERRGAWRTMSPGRWGFAVEGETAVVWYSVDERIQSVRVPAEEPVPVRAITIAFVAMVLLFLWAMTVCGFVAFLRSLKLRDDFVAATAHDLTTPLVALRRLVGQDVNEEKALVERLLRLVANLTDFLRLGGSLRKVPLGEVDLVQAFDEAYRLFSADYRWTLGRDVSREGPASLLVEADEQKVVQILWNLLGNDLKYAAPFGAVSVRFSEDGDWGCVSFVDEGKGLSKKDRKRIFRRYVRLKSARQSGKGGFGVGLCTSREAARVMGGDLTVGDNTPTGCVFTLKLRKAKAR